MPFSTDVDALTVRRHGDDEWRLTTAVRYVGQHDTFTIPTGYVTDFASVPAIVVWLIPRFGRYTPAAILHDYLITDVLSAGQITSNDVDGLFRRVMRELGVSTPRRWLMWAGVRWGALVQPARRPGWWRDAPAVLAVSLASLPVVLPGVVGAALGLGLFALVELVSPARPPVGPQPEPRGSLLDMDALRREVARREGLRTSRRLAARELWWPCSNPDCPGPSGHPGPCPPEKG